MLDGLYIGLWLSALISALILYLSTLMFSIEYEFV
jgi:hypothetical protein